jgi:hypothetical protein
MVLSGFVGLWIEPQTTDPLLLMEISTFQQENAKMLSWKFGSGVADAVPPDVSVDDPRANLGASRTKLVGYQ